MCSKKKRPRDQRGENACCYPFTVLANPALEEETDNEEVYDVALMHIPGAEMMPECV